MQEPGTSGTHLQAETLTTEELLRLHERHFGPLHPRARARLAARMRQERARRHEREAAGWRGVGLLAA